MDCERQSKCYGSSICRCLNIVILFLVVALGIVAGGIIGALQEAFILANLVPFILLAVTFLIGIIATWVFYRCSCRC